MAARALTHLPIMMMEFIAWRAPYHFLPHLRIEPMSLECKAKVLPQVSFKSQLLQFEFKVLK